MFEKIIVYVCQHFFFLCENEYYIYHIMYPILQLIITFKTCDKNFMSIFISLEKQIFLCNFLNVVIKQ